MKQKNVQSRSFLGELIVKYFLLPLLVLIIGTAIGGLVLYWLRGDDHLANATYSATSYDQTGGITAGQVNVNLGKPQRHLDAPMKEKLESYRDKKIILSIVMPDAESAQFGSEIAQYLQREAFNFKYYQDMGVAPEKGWRFKENIDGSISLIIGSNL